jgi:UDP-glucose 4-epimerase
MKPGMESPGQCSVVTGGAGFIGSHLVESLVEAGKRTVVVDDLSSGSLDNLRGVASKIEFHQADIRCIGAMVPFFEGAEIVYHLAANASVPISVDDPHLDFEVNALGTHRVLLAARDAGVKRIVMCSSAAVYGIPTTVPISETHQVHPVSPYGASKAAGEALALSYKAVYGLDTVICRIFNSYGPRQRRYVMHDLYMKLMRNRRELSVRGDGYQIRDYCHVADVTRAIILVAQHGQGIYNISGGVAVSIREVAEAIVRIVAPGTPIRYGEATWRGDIPTLHGDISRIRRIGFEPQVDLESGIRDLVEEHRKAL